jgi:hypothetical protein
VTDTAERPRRHGREGQPRRGLVSLTSFGLLAAVGLTVVSRATTSAAHDAQRDGTRLSVGTRSHHVHSTRHHTAATHKHAAGTVQALPSVPKSKLRGPTTSTIRTPSTTTTTSVAPPTTTTEPPTTTSTPDLLNYSGVLRYPDDVAASIPFSSATGVAATRITWSGGEELVASLRCRGAHDSAPGTHGISISIDGSPGTCVVAVALDPESAHKSRTRSPSSPRAVTDAHEETPDRTAMQGPSDDSAGFA